MAPRRLHGSVECIGTQRVMATLLEHQVEFEFVAVHPEATHTPPFLALSPFGEIPVFEDGDLTLFVEGGNEIHIAQYATGAIQQVYMTPLVQGMATTWIDVETHHFQEPALRLIKGNHEAAEEERRMDRVLDVYEARLTAFEFLGGDMFTAADITHMPYIHALLQTELGKRLLLDEARPHVASWCTTLLSRPSWARLLQMLLTYSNTPN